MKLLTSQAPRQKNQLSLLSCLCTILREANMLKELRILSVFSSSSLLRTVTLIQNIRPIALNGFSYAISQQIYNFFGISYWVCLTNSNRTCVLQLTHKPNVTAAVLLVVSAVIGKRFGMSM